MNEFKDTVVSLPKPSSQDNIEILELQQRKNLFEEEMKHARLTGFTNNSANTLEYSPSPNKHGIHEASRTQNNSKVNSSKYELSPSNKTKESNIQVLPQHMSDQNFINLKSNQIQVRSNLVSRTGSAHIVVQD